MSILAALVLAQVVVIQPSPSPSPSPPTGNDIPFSVAATAGAVVTLAGDADTSVQPTAFVNAEGPIILGNISIGRIMAQLGLSTLPGDAVNLADAKTFRSAKARFSYGYVVGERGVQTLIGGEVAFDSRLDTDAISPVTRLSRSYAGTLTLRDPASHSGLTVGYGRDEACGPRRYGQWIVHGDVALPGHNFRIFGDASLSAGPKQTGVVVEPSRDILFIGVRADIGELIH